MKHKIICERPEFSDLDLRPAEESLGKTTIKHRICDLDDQPESDSEIGPEIYLNIYLNIYLKSYLGNERECRREMIIYKY